MTTAKRNGIFFWRGVGGCGGGVVIRKLLLNGRGILTFRGRGTKIWQGGVYWRECCFSR